MTLDEALAGKEIPGHVRKDLVLATVPFLSFDTETREGQLVVHAALGEEVGEIFEKLRKMQFPIEQMTPIVAFNWNDGASMAANNTSAFNYRLIADTDRLSNHSYGRAIDINPVQNPYMRKGKPASPPGAEYDVSKPGTVTPEIVSLFKSYGWSWGGDWVALKDWQHFEKL